VGLVDFHNIERSIEKANKVDVRQFDNAVNSYVNFTLEINVARFRHLVNVKVDFSNPVTIISGTNKVGKTSLLLLLACSHEQFFRLDASKPDPTLRAHIWKDVMAFTKYETEKNDYSYKLKWRKGKKVLDGEGKRLASSEAWSGLAKKAKDRTNAKIKDREVRLVDLDRLLPARSFSASLLRKAANATSAKLSEDVSKAFCYVLDIAWTQAFSILEVSGHVNKRCYVVDNGNGAYSSYNAASGEESLIAILRDAIESPAGSLVLIDEIEAGLHPSVQRKLAKVLRSC
jgi:predicted ATPase